MKEPTDHIRKMIYSYVQGQLTEEQIMELWEHIARKPELMDLLEMETGLRELSNAKKSD